MKKLTEEQLLARDEAKVAARRAKIEKRKARQASAEVRGLERIRAVLVTLVNDRGVGSLKLTDVLAGIETELASARKAAVPQ